MTCACSLTCAPLPTSPLDTIVDRSGVWHLRDLLEEIRAVQARGECPCAGSLGVCAAASLCLFGICRRVDPGCVYHAAAKHDPFVIVARFSDGTRALCYLGAIEQATAWDRSDWTLDFDSEAEAQKAIDRYYVRERAARAGALGPVGVMRASLALLVQRWEAL